MTLVPFWRLTMHRNRTRVLTNDRVKKIGVSGFKQVFLKHLCMQSPILLLSAVWEPRPTVHMPLNQQWGCHQSESQNVTSDTAPKETSTAGRRDRSWVALKSPGSCACTDSMWGLEPQPLGWWTRASRAPSPEAHLKEKPGGGGKHWIHTSAPNTNCLA